MEDEYLSIAVKQSTMWEINNPRVNSLVRGFYKIVNESNSYSNEQKDELYYILISLINVYGNKKWC
tara:strand:- start:425 stop:622 length:198 start_codon:yes stop_codon:yes gene_type:complete